MVNEFAKNGLEPEGDTHVHVRQIIRVVEFNGSGKVLRNEKSSTENLTMNWLDIGGFCFPSSSRIRFYLMITSPK